jgi:hypothetical protein
VARGHWPTGWEMQRYLLVGQTISLFFALPLLGLSLTFLGPSKPDELDQLEKRVNRLEERLNKESQATLDKPPAKAKSNCSLTR